MKIKAEIEELFQKLMRWDMTRFVVVGGVSYLIDYGLLYVFKEFVFSKIASGIYIAQVLSFTISLIVHYFLATFWVFRGHSVKSAASHARASSLFVITNVMGLGLNLIILYFGSTLLGFHYLIVKLFAAAIVMVWNYAAQKFFVYRR